MSKIALKTKLYCSIKAVNSFETHFCLPLKIIFLISQLFIVNQSSLIDKVAINFSGVCTESKFYHFDNSSATVCHSKTICFDLLLHLSNFLTNPLPLDYLQLTRLAVSNISSENAVSETIRTIYSKMIVQPQRPMRVKKNSKSPSGPLQFRSDFRLRYGNFLSTIWTTSTATHAKHPNWILSRRNA